MAKVSPVRRINKEDFPRAAQPIIDGLSTLLNASLEEITNAINGNLSVSDNLNEYITYVDVEVNASGIPLVDTSVRIVLKSRCKGLVVIRAEDISGTTAYVTTAPFVTFTEGNLGILSVKHVTGLPVNKKFRLTIRATG